MKPEDHPSPDEVLAGPETMESDLASRFVALLGGGSTPLSAVPNLGPALKQALARARGSWPDLDLPTEVFLRFLARHYPAAQADPARALEAMHLGDMYLVAGCLSGNALAIEIFERQFFLTSSPTLVRLQLPTDLLEETRQVLRHRFFVGKEGAEPRLAEYAGAGPLRGWVRVAMVWTALSLRRTPVALVGADAEMLARIASPERDLEFAYFKRLYGAVAKDALRHALGTLSVRERNLLRESFGLDLSIDELSLLYRVHRSTVARWLAGARAALVEEMRAEIKRRLAIPSEEISSILQLIQSQLGDVICDFLGVSAEAQGT